MLQIKQIQIHNYISEKHPNRLLEWQPTLNDVLNAAEQFVKYNCEDDAVIVQNIDGRWSIYTKGENMKPEIIEEVTTNV